MQLGARRKSTTTAVTAPVRRRLYIELCIFFSILDCPRVCSAS